MVSINIHINDDDIKRKVMAAMEQFAYDLKSKSQELCPVDKGTLRDSALVEVTGDTITVGYGGAASSYAVVQHESMSFHHNVGQAKFLEQPFDEMKSELAERLRKAISG
jgi:hypothetical protein